MSSVCYYHNVCRSSPQWSVSLSSVPCSSINFPEKYWCKWDKGIWLAVLFMSFLMQDRQGCESVSLGKWGKQCSVDNCDATSIWGACRVTCSKFAHFLFVSLSFMLEPSRCKWQTRRSNITIMIADGWNLSYFWMKPKIHEVYHNSSRRMKFACLNLLPYWMLVSHWNYIGIKGNGDRHLFSEDVDLNLSVDPLTDSAFAMAWSWLWFWFHFRNQKMKTLKSMSWIEASHQLSTSVLMLCMPYIVLTFRMRTL